MITIVSNYRTGSSTFHQSLGGDGNEYCHISRGGYKSPSPESDGQNGVYKIMPDHFDYENGYEKFKVDYLQKSDKIYYTLRANIRDQIESHLYALKTSDWHSWQAIGSPIPNKENFNARTSSYLLLRCLCWQVKIYREFGGTLVWLEDRNQDQKYSRRVDYTLPDIDVDIAIFDYLDVRGMFL